MRFEEIITDKKSLLDLLLLADEQEDMIDRYLNQGQLFALYDPEVVCVAVILKLNDQECELKNIATLPSAQRQGYGTVMIQFLITKFLSRYQTIYVGTGDVPETLAFYQKCGFRNSHRVKNFFTDNYREPIIDHGVHLIDMVYLRIDK
ncbi:GNAT family N-acetyltransferase [Enterococcus xiangfangensis]|uniref:GNAT family N-acetyltransferase n=1 Tax=Enterococcus xiangfangensis TaxID=1296537 RepID=UPI0010F87916|nr:GNAT family N-acetyltransferase [Enterococcus xiangfangensis]MBM7711241.1 GNAT superfamily N-acetyltransferase [Enterococcus xiangfangensis]NBK09435.1 N-acetyltransferase [Enterococcus asini]